MKLTFSCKVILTSCRPILSIIHHTLYKERLNNNNIIIEKQIQFTEVKICLSGSSASVCPLSAS